MHGIKGWSGVKLLGEVSWLKMKKSIHIRDPVPDLGLFNCVLAA